MDGVRRLATLKYSGVTTPHEIPSPIGALRSNVPNFNVRDLTSSWETSTSPSPRFQIQLTQPLKWHRLELSFYSVFSGGTDWQRNAIPDLDRIVEYIRKVRSRAALNLVSVVGSCFFLELTRRLNPERVILFDKNVMEFLKLSILLKNLGSIENFQVRTEEEVNDTFCQFGALPPGGGGGQCVSFQERAGSAWMTADGPVGSSFPILMSWADYPDHRISINREEVERTASMLRTALRSEVFGELPKLNVNREIAVVFLSNIPREIISDKDVHRNIVNSSGTLIIRSRDLGSDDFRNTAALDPHEYWEVTLGSLLPKSGWTHELFPEELRHIASQRFQLETGNFDYFKRNSQSFLDDGSAAIPSSCETLVTHILLGKARKQKTLARRTRVVAKYLRGLPAHISQVIVAEFNPLSQRGWELSRCFPKVKSLAGFYAEALPEFELQDISFSPGAKEVKRNLFLRFRRG